MDIDGLAEIVRNNHAEMKSIFETQLKSCNVRICKIEDDLDNVEDKQSVSDKCLVTLKTRIKTVGSIFVFLWGAILVLYTMFFDK